MTKENKTLFLIIAMSTLIIATVLSIIVYLIFGPSTGYFFVIVFSIPIGAVSSLLLMLLYNAKKK